MYGYKSFSIRPKNKNELFLVPARLPFFTFYFLLFRRTKAPPPPPPPKKKKREEACAIYSVEITSKVIQIICFVIAL